MWTAVPPGVVAGAGLWSVLAFTLNLRLNRVEL